MILFQKTSQSAQLKFILRLKPEEDSQEQKDHSQKILISKQCLPSIRHSQHLDSILHD